MVFSTEVSSVVSPSIASSGSNLYTGSRGSAVISLQQFLITQNTGPAAKRLAEAGATGYFGSVTKNALKEFQSSVGIKPASGYFGPITRAFIASGENTSQDGKVVFYRNLALGTTGEDVRALQKYLNKNNYLITQSGPGSLGNETNYFGPLTQRALRLFQIEHNISPALGYFGPITLAFINSQ
jgi:peptidoglycan hydrolase-like protein with peptidoglycan-binding domain